MPKSTRDDGAVRLDEQIAGMHVGMEEAVAQRVAQEGLDEVGGDRLEIVAGGASAATSDILMPSIHSSVSTSRPVRTQSTDGHAEAGIVLGVLAKLGKGCGLEPADPSRSWWSGRASSSPRPGAGGARRGCIAPAAGRRGNSSRGRAGSARRTPGRITLTATLVGTPSRSTSAAWTCAMEAAATGSPKLRKSSPTGRPSEPSMAATESAIGKVSMRSCSSARSSAMSLPTTSGRVARNWPSLT